MNIESLEGPNSNDQYQEIDFHRKGGMGEIYTSIDTVTGDMKAIKIIPIDSDEEYQLLKAEFEISVSLNHENVVKTDFYNEFEKKGTRYLYSVMKFSEQGSFREFIASKTEYLSVSDSIKFMNDLVKGLEYAHETIIHRDLKPENILIDENESLQICDFGLAKLIDSKTRTRTFKGSGTLPYMAPECWMFDSNTVAMDIYSLGIIFYEILTLKVPFNGKSESEIRDKHLYEPLPNISNERVDLPVRLVELVNKMTNKRPQERYSSVSEVKKVLNEIGSKIDDTSDSKIDNLLNKANQRITESQKRQLAEQKEQELIDTKRKFTDVAINNLFDKFNSRINSVNESLERNKITVNRSNNHFSASFMGKSFSISFYPSSDIPEVLKRGKEAVLQRQKQQYGFVIQAPEKNAHRKRQCHSNRSSHIR